MIKGWYRTGELMGEAKVLNGLLFYRNGYYKNGQLEYEENYQYGLLDGKVTRWDEQGKVVDECTYVQGKLLSKHRCKIDPTE